MSEGKKPHPAIKDALSLDGDPEHIKAYYAKWAESYDHDVEGHYTAPRIIVGLLSEHLAGETALPGRVELSIADAGCGTGLVGSVLHSAGFRTFDGMDISQEMVDRARDLGVYRRLYGDVDLNAPLRTEWMGAYDAVLCCGVFTLGHVPPSLLNPLLDMVKTGGLIIASTRTAYYESTDYQNTSDRLLASGRAELVKVLRDAPYTDDGNAHYWIYRKLESTDVHAGCR